MTSRTSSSQVVMVLGAVAALMALAATLQRVREDRFPMRVAADESLYVTSGSAVRHMSAGFTALAADLYWIRAIQHYGGARLSVANPQANGASDSRGEYALLYPLLDLTTTLDPRFNIAYRFGSLFLAEPYPGGAGRPDLAIALLEKGLRERPDKWEYMQDIGFVHYWWKHDYRAAADWFDRGSKVPGAPWWLRSLAATTLAQGGDRRSSRTMWESIRESAEIDWLKNDAERRLQQLDALDFIDKLQPIVDEYARTTGQPPSDWSVLVGAKRIPGVPVDPARTPYEIDERGRVRVSGASPLFPIPEEPATTAVPAS